MNMIPEYSETQNQTEINQIEDMIMVCVQCDEEFDFSIQEQEKYEERGYDIPKRCPSCRKHKSRSLDLTENRRHIKRKRGLLFNKMNEDW